MALKSQEREIGGRTYRVTQLSPDVGIPFLTSLMQLVGPSLGGFLAGMADKDTFDASMLRGASEALYEVARRVTPAEMKRIVDTLAPTTTLVWQEPGEAEPREQNLAHAMKAGHFAGEYQHLFAWIRFALEVNYASFFDGAGGLPALIKRAAVILPYLSPSPKASTGSSTESQAADGTIPA